MPFYKRIFALQHPRSIAIFSRAAATIFALFFLLEGSSAVSTTSAALAWDANPASDNASGYRIYYGTESGNYTNIIDVGNETSVALENLAKGTTYYVVLTAYNASGLESPPSEEFLFVSASNAAPVIELTQLGDETVISAPGNIVLVAAANDEDGSVTRVNFYDGDVLLYSDAHFPFAIRVFGLRPGIHSLRAVAFDDSGDESESSSLGIEVRLPSAPKLKISQFQLGETPSFDVKAPPGQDVMLQASNNLVDWSTVTRSQADQDGDVSLEDPTPAADRGSQRFYRIAYP